MSVARLFPIERRPAPSSGPHDASLRQNPLFDPAFYAREYALETLDVIDLYRHYVYVGRFDGFDPNGYFSTSWYLGQYRDVRERHIDPLDHYLEHGAIEGRNPSPAFSTGMYRLLYPDVAASGMNPLLHFLRHGRDEGRLATPIALIPGLSATCAAGSGPPPAAGAPPLARAPVERSRPGYGLTAPSDGASRIRPIRHGSGRAARPAAERVIRRRSPWLVRLFAAIFARDLAASFHGIRLLGRLPAPVDGPVVVLTNHPSWWDAELYHWLAVTGFPDRRGFAPMDAAHLGRHRFLERLGAFPVSPGSFSGAAAFLATSERILRERDSILFVAAEGRFRDVRDPIRLMPGVAHLAQRVPEATIIPLAIDYVFWRERRPNLLLRFGEPIRAEALAGSTLATTAHLSAALATAMSALAEAGQSRQPRRFRTLLEGRVRIGAVREALRWVFALPGGPRRTADARTTR